MKSLDKMYDPVLYIHTAPNSIQNMKNIFFLNPVHWVVEVILFFIKFYFIVWKKMKGDVLHILKIIGSSVW